MSPLPDLLTVEEAATYLRRSEYHVRHLLRTGKILGRKLAPRGPWLIPADQIETALVGVGVRGKSGEVNQNQEKSAA